MEQGGHPPGACLVPILGLYYFEVPVRHVKILQGGAARKSPPLNSHRGDGIPTFPPKALAILPMAPLGSGNPLCVSRWRKHKLSG